MTYKQHIKRNRNNTVRARAKKYMRKRNSYRYSGRGGVIDDIRDGIKNATQAANSGLSTVAAGINDSDAMKRMVAVGKVFNTPEDKANAAEKLANKAHKKVKSIQDKLAKHQGEKDKLSQELTKAQTEHQDALNEHMDALKKLNTAAPAPAPIPAPMPAPMPAPPMKRPAPRPAPSMKRPGSSMKRPALRRAATMKTQPFNRTKYGR